MTAPLAFLHTSPVHVPTFEGLVAQQWPGLAVQHSVDEGLLADAQRLGAGYAGVVARVQAGMRALADAGAQVVVCTCSTVGGAAERTAAGGRFVAQRIDRAMADQAVACGPDVLVVAALASTLGPTQALLAESAAALGKPLTPQTLCVDAAWPLFVAGDRAGYLQALVQAVTHTLAQRAQPPDAVVLAQASMAPAQAALAHLPCPVLASPALGVAAALAVLRGPGGAAR